MGLAASKQEAFWEACGFGHTNRVRRFLEDPNIDVNWVSYTHNSCAIHVASQGKKEIVQMLIDAKCNINARDDRDNLALHHAAMKGHAEIIQMLIDAGSEIDAKDKNDWTALINAAYYCHMEAVETLLKNGCGASIMNKDQRTALHEACRSHSTDENALAIIACFLIEAGCDLNAKSSDVGEADFTALMFTAYHGHAEMADAIAEAGCDINAQGSNGWSALHWAADRDHKEVVEVLLHWGINPLLQGRRGELAQGRAKDPDVREILQKATVAARYEEDMEEMMSRSSVSTTSPCSSRAESLENIIEEESDTEPEPAVANGAIPTTAARPLVGKTSMPATRSGTNATVNMDTNDAITAAAPPSKISIDVSALLQRGSKICQLKKRSPRAEKTSVQKKTLEEVKNVTQGNNENGLVNPVNCPSPQSTCLSPTSSSTSTETSQASVIETDTTTKEEAPGNEETTPTDVPELNVDLVESPQNLKQLSLKDAKDSEKLDHGMPDTITESAKMSEINVFPSNGSEVVLNGGDSCDVNPVANGETTILSSNDVKPNISELDNKPDVETLDTEGGELLKHPAVQALLSDHHGNESDDGNFSDDLLGEGGYSEDLVDSDMDL